MSDAPRVGLIMPLRTKGLPLADVIAKLQALNDRLTHDGVLELHLSCDVDVVGLRLATAKEIADTEEYRRLLLAEQAGVLR